MESVVETEAAVQFDQTLKEIGAEHLSPQAGRQAALVAAAGLVWEGHLGKLYSTGELKDVMGVSRQAINERVQRGTLFALRQSSGEYAYPAFQFDHQGQPLKPIIDVLPLFPEEIADRYTVASWFVSSQPLLEGNTPVDWVAKKRSTETLMESARRVAVRLRQ